MTITKTSYVERVLIVLNADGTLKGAHSQTLDAIVEDGVVLRETQGDAVPVDAASLSIALPDKGALVEQVQALTSERDSLATERDALKSERDAMLAEKDGLAASRDAESAKVASLEGLVAELTAERDGLAAEVASLTQQVEALTPSPVDLPAQIKMECERRIYAVADTNTQMNMVAAAVAGLLDEDGRAALAKAVQWVGAMRAACVALIAAEDETFQDGTHWPVCPPDVAALANAF